VAGFGGRLGEKIKRGRIDDCGPEQQGWFGELEIAHCLFQTAWFGGDGGQRVRWCLCRGLIRRWLTCPLGMVAAVGYR